MEGKNCKEDNSWKSAYLNIPVSVPKSCSRVREWTGHDGIAIILKCLLCVLPLIYTTLNRVKSMQFSCHPRECRTDVQQ